MESYEYREFDAGSNHIRLVKVLPGTGQLECEILHVRLERKEPRSYKRPSLAEVREKLPAGCQVEEAEDGRYVFLDGASSSWINPDPAQQHIDVTPPPAPSATVQYDALSYVWQPINPTEQLNILEDGTKDFRPKCISIGSNLASAMRHLRHPERARVLWVDAISINQADMIERQQQVQMMKEIYTLAHAVLIWLGEEADESALAVPALSYLGKQALCTKSNYRFRSPDATEYAWWNCHVVIPYEPKMWIAIAILLYRPWFRRMWVYQENQVANERATMHVGKHSMTLLDFRTALQIVKEKTNGIPELTRYYYQTAFEMVKRWPTLPLRPALAFASDKQCSDPKDKIYALMGLFPDDLAQKITPRYDLPTVDCYKQAFLTFAQYCESLEFFVQCGAPETDEEPYWPSWVPRFGTNTTRFQSQMASGLSEARFRQLSDNVLEVCGMKCAIVASVSEADSSRSWDGSAVQSLQAWYSQCVRQRDVCHDDLYYCVEMLSGFLLRERNPDAPYCNTIEEWKEFLAGGDSSILTMTALSHGHGNIYGRSLIICEGNFFAVGPPWTKQGDVLSIVLGCTHPLILRPITPEQYQFVGACIAPQLRDATAMLGPLGDGYCVELATDPDGNQRLSFVGPDGMQLDGDPRLPPLPPDWEPSEKYSSRLDVPEVYQTFRNTVTGEEIRHDPRMTWTALRERGVAVEKFQLV